MRESHPEEICSRMKGMPPPISEFTTEQSSTKHLHISIHAYLSQWYWPSGCRGNARHGAVVVSVSESEDKVNVPETCERCLSRSRMGKIIQPELQHKTSAGKQTSRDRTRSQPCTHTHAAVPWVRVEHEYPPPLDHDISVWKHTHAPFPVSYYCHEIHPNGAFTFIYINIKSLSVLQTFFM